MNFKKNMLNVLATAVFAAILAACSHTLEPIDIAADSNPSEVIELQNKELAKSRSNGVDVLSPTNYTKAREHLEDAQAALANEKDQKEVLRQVGISKAYLKNGNLVSSRSKGNIAPVLDAREAAQKARAQTTHPKEFSEVDQDLAEIGKGFEQDKNSIDADDLAKLQQKYLDLQVKAMKQTYLGSAYSILEKAENDGASSVVPKTYQETKLKVLGVEKYIDANRTDEAGIESSAMEAREQAVKLSFVFSKANASGGKKSEGLAIALYEQEKAKGNLQAQLNDARVDISNATASLTETETQNAALKSSVNLQNKIAALREQFSPNEAEISQQGQKVIFRLRTIQFSKNKADLPTSAVTVLGKLKDSIKGLNAEKVLVEGHTDSLGTKAINEKISKERADIVKNYLTSDATLSPSIVESAGYGYMKPLTTNKTKEGRAENRRVDIVVTPGL